MARASRRFSRSAHHRGASPIAGPVSVLRSKRPAELARRSPVVRGPDLFRQSRHTIVEENNLTQSISKLRQVLGEAPGVHRFIVAIPGRGYRFVAEVNSGGIREGSASFQLAFFWWRSPTHHSAAATPDIPRAEKSNGHTESLASSEQRQRWRRTARRDLGRAGKHYRLPDRQRDTDLPVPNPIRGERHPDRFDLGHPAGPETPGEGLWIRAGGNTYSFRFKPFSFDAQNVFTGWTIIQQEATLDPTGNSYTSSGTSEIYNTSGS